MNSDAELPRLTNPSEEYNKGKWSELIRSITIALNALRTPGKVRCETININQIPTASAGLRSGDVWSDLGTLKIVA